MIALLGIVAGILLARKLVRTKPYIQITRRLTDESTP